MIQWLADNGNVLIAISAIVAVIISAASIAIAVWSIRSQQKHNRLSVKPIGHVGVGDWQNEQYVRIENNGSGPLIVEKITILEGKLEHTESLVELMPELPRNLYWKNFVVEALEERAILPGKSIILLHLEGDERDGIYGSYRDKVRRALGKLTLIVEYRNIYGKRMPPKSRELEWFCRHWKAHADDSKQSE